LLQVWQRFTAALRRGIEGWKLGSPLKERQSEKSDATIFDRAIRERNINTAVGRPPCKRPWATDELVEHWTFVLEELAN
jgi:hypothetical protein